MKKNLLQLPASKVIIVLLLSIGSNLLYAQQQIIQVKALFPRNQTYEYQMLKALNFNPNPSLTNVDLNETLKLYSQLSPLEQALGRLGLLAAEIYAASSNEQYDAQRMLSNIANRNMPDFKPQITGILAVLVMNEVSKSSAEASVVALKKWSADVFRSIKVRSAKAILDEYNVWKSDPCGYKGEGYKPQPDCALKDKNYAEWISSKSPPQDIIAKAGLKSVLTKSSGFGNFNADQVASVVAIGLSSVATAMAAAALTSTLGVVTGTTASGVASLTTLSVAFSSSSAAEGAIGALGWTSVVAAPVAAAVMIIVVGTMEGFRVVEDTKVEPMLKMKLGAAMAERINITNVINDISARDMFYIAFMESAQNGFQIAQPKVDGEVRFFCQAGYVAKFKLSYSANIDKTGWKPEYKTVEFTTKDLSVGNEESFTIPFDATNIKVEGWYAAGGWKPLLNQTIAIPTFVCYTAYGTIFGARCKMDCPEVGNMIAKPNQLTVTQGGGYAAWVSLTYNLNGKTVVAQDQKGLTFGWRKVYDIPVDAKDIKLVIKEATGLAWEPWKKVIEKNWPVSPNECIKVYGTTIDPKWNMECK